MQKANNLKKIALLLLNSENLPKMASNLIHIKAMSKSQDAKKEVKKKPAKTTKEKQAEKKEKKGKG